MVGCTVHAHPHQRSGWTPQHSARILRALIFFRPSDLLAVAHERTLLELQLARLLRELARATAARGHAVAAPAAGDAVAVARVRALPNLQYSQIERITSEIHNIMKGRNEESWEEGRRLTWRIQPAPSQVVRQQWTQQSEPIMSPPEGCGALCTFR